MNKRTHHPVRTILRKAALAAVSAGALCAAVPAHAAPTTPEVLLERAKRGDFPRNTHEGEGWMLVLTARNKWCGKSRADKDYRSRRLLNKAEQLGRHRDWDSAVALSREINKSSMYISCWRTIDTFTFGVSVSVPTN
ncbi:MAG: hypothetical protein AAF662_09555 [Pseudomonadota bacterium]